MIIIFQEETALGLNEGIAPYGSASHLSDKIALNRFALFFLYLRAFLTSAVLQTQLGERCTALSIYVEVMNILEVMLRKSIRKPSVYSA